MENFRTEWNMDMKTIIYLSFLIDKSVRVK